MTREEAIKKLQKQKAEYLDEWVDYSNISGAYDMAIKALEQPEIILCKDCKHWLDIDDGRQKHRMCADIYGDWYCADAERRTDE